MEVLQLLFTLSEDYPGLNEEIITSACLAIYKVSVCDDYTAPWGWLLLHGGGYCSMGMLLFHRDNSIFACIAG